LPLLYAFTGVARSQAAYAGISWRHGYRMAARVFSRAIKLYTS